MTTLPCVAQKVILDVDTGTDDAVAIMFAALHPELDLVGVTTVNGNVPVRYCTDNSLRVLDFIGRSQVPVYEGLARPLVRLDFPTPKSYGRDSAEDMHGTELPIPAPTSVKQDTGAVEFLVETLRATTEQITLVPVGPLSNIGAALAIDPRIADAVHRVVIMGGGHAFGNETASAEFNIWADPEAADMVFAAGFRDLTLVPLDATHRALVTKADCDASRRSALLPVPRPPGSSAAASTRTRAAIASQLRTPHRCTTRSVRRCSSIPTSSPRGTCTFESRQPASSRSGGR